MNSTEKINYVRGIAHNMARDAAEQGLGVADPNHVDHIAVSTANIIPDEVFMSFSGDKLAATVANHIRGVSKDIVEKSSTTEDENDKQSSAHGGVNMTMSYFDRIMLAGEQASDKVAAYGGNDAQVDVTAASARLDLIGKDPMAAIDANYVKTAAIQDVVVKLAGVVEQLAAKNATDISATQGAARADDQGGEGQQELSEEELKKLAAVVADPSNGRTVMEGDPTGKESEITDPKNAENGNGGLAANSKATTGDLIASSRARSKNVTDALTKIKAMRKARS